VEFGLLLLRVVLWALAFASLVCAMRLAVSWAKRRGGGTALTGDLADIIASSGLGSTLNPAEQIAEDKRRLTRNESGSADPEKRQPDEIV